MNPIIKHARPAFVLAAKRAALLVSLVATLTTLSSAQLANTATSENFGCSGWTPPRPNNATAYSNWTYTDSSGTKHFFNGSDYVEVEEEWYEYPREAPITCGENITTSLDAYSTDGLYYLQATGGGGSATAAGFVNPKYVVVGVTYAPPGPSSFVQYTGTTSVGNTVTIANSFSNDVGFSVSVMAGISGWGTGGGVTGTSSTDYMQGSNSSKTTTFTKLTSLAYKTDGTGNAFSPVDHDYDTIWLWLNPVVLLTYTPATSKTVAGIQWNGYGYDTNDPSGKDQPDVYPVQVGWLNGDFGNNASVDKILARGWVTTYEPTMIWAGTGPGLTSTDIANIIAADPLTGDYTLLDSFPSTTSDGRFTIEQGPNNPNPIPYTQAGPGNGGGITTIYGTTQTDTESDAQGTSHTFKQGFGLQEVFSGTVFGIGLKTTLTETDTLTWTHSWLNTLTTTTTLQDSLSVTGPNCPAPPPGPCNPLYGGPGQFLLYQDNQFGTFLFYPSN